MSIVYVWLNTFKRLINGEIAETNFADPPHLIRKHAEDAGPGQVEVSTRIKADGDLQLKPSVEKISVLSPLSLLRSRAEIEADAVSSLLFLSLRRTRGIGPAL